MCYKNGQTDIKVKRCVYVFYLRSIKSSKCTRKRRLLKRRSTPRAIRDENLILLALWRGVKYAYTLSISPSPFQTLFWFDLIALNKWITVENSPQLLSSLPLLPSPYVYPPSHRAKTFIASLKSHRERSWNKEKSLKVELFLRRKEKCEEEVMCVWVYIRYQTKEIKQSHSIFPLGVIHPLESKSQPPTTFMRAVLRGKLK